MTDSSDDTAIERLRSSLGGDLITPDSPGYDDARAVFNAMIDRRPALIAQCGSPHDVVLALGHARENGLDIAVRGGGHSVAGMALVEDGLVIDLRRMNQVIVDPETRTAVVGGGATMSDLDRACQPHGLATTGGRVSTTGVGGFTLGGGSGWFDRQFGLACDNLVAVELVTADGGMIRASDDENPELFWALHGGGGNFGVATSLTLRLHPLATATLGLLLWSPEDGPKLVRAYRDLIDSAPDQLGGGVLYMTGPEGEDFVPDHLVGRLTLGIALTYAGPEEELRRVIAPLLALSPEGQMISEMPYADLQSALDDPPGLRNYWSAEQLHSLPDEAIEAFCARAHDMIVPSASQHVMFPLGGAVARGPAEYPIPWRSSPWVVHPFGLWTDPADDERGIKWAKDVCTDMRPWSSGAVYLNFIGDEGADRVLAGLGPESYARLVAVKSEYDPDNLFRRNHNIAPAVPTT